MATLQCFNFFPILYSSHHYPSVGALPYQGHLSFFLGQVHQSQFLRHRLNVMYWLQWWFVGLGSRVSCSHRRTYLFGLCSLLLRWDVVWQQLFQNWEVACWRVADIFWRFNVKHYCEIIFLHLKKSWCLSAYSNDGPSTVKISEANTLPSELAGPGNASIYCLYSFSSFIGFQFVLIFTLEIQMIYECAFLQYIKTVLTIYSFFYQINYVNVWVFYYYFHNIILFYISKQMNI